MNNKFIYTPGPTIVRENVRFELAKNTTNPDIDMQFYDFYKNTCKKISSILNTQNDVYILSGEGILGLEAACASLTQPNDKVLVIDNGIFGRGFDKLIKMYGGQVVYFSGDYNKEIDIKELEKFLEKENDFKYATIVHCDTPTGVLNDLSEICPLLKKHNILTVVDSVSAMIGEKLDIDHWQIDIALGASQKAISAPAGLCIVSVSEDAKNAMKNRKVPIIGFYSNLTIWQDYYEKKWFPYTMPINEIIAFDKAIDNILEEKIENVLARHEKIATATRKAFTEYGLKLYLENGYSNTVTAVEIPKEIGALNLTKHILEKYNMLISTSLSDYKDKLLRIGHMGENARLEYVVYVLNTVDKSLKELGFDSDKNLVELFNKYYSEN